MDVVNNNMVLLEKLKNEIDIIPVEPEQVHPLVLKHYLQKWPQNVKVIYGVYHNGQIIGAAIYGYPMKSATQVLNPEVDVNEVLELKRLFIEEEPKLLHIESYVIAKTLKMIKQSFPEVKVVITFADNRQGHLGVIYQATNAIYLGKSSGQLHKYAYILRGNVEAIKSKLASKPYPKKN